MSGRAVQRVSRMEIVLAFLFGSLAIAAVLWLAFRNASLTEPQFDILRIGLALAGGGVGAVIPGFLELNMKIGTKLALRAGGALAVFVVLCFWSPARWQPAHDGSNYQHTEGPGSPIQSGSGNKAIYWLRVSGVAGLGERERSSEDPGVPPRCDDFVILWVGSRNFVIPEPCGVAAPSALSQFGAQRPADASRDGVG